MYRALEVEPSPDKPRKGDVHYEAANSYDGVVHIELVNGMGGGKDEEYAYEYRELYECVSKYRERSLRGRAYSKAGEVNNPGEPTKMERTAFGQAVREVVR